jgi:hypothetical protein
MGYGIAVSGVRSATITSNALQSPTSFTGSQGVNCTSPSYSPRPVPFVVDRSRVSDDTILQQEFQSVDGADSLICVPPPDEGGWWGYSGRPHDTPPALITSDKDPGSSDSGIPHNDGGTHGSSVGLAVGLPLAILAVLVGSWYFRRWYIRWLKRRNTERTNSMEIGLDERSWNRRSKAESEDNDEAYGGVVRY